MVYPSQNGIQNFTVKEIDFKIPIFLSRIRSGRKVHLFMAEWSGISGII